MRNKGKTSQQPSHERKTTQKDVIRIWDSASNLENLQQVKILSVDIPNQGNWRRNLSNITLLHENLLCFRTQKSNFQFIQQFPSQQLFREFDHVHF